MTVAPLFVRGDGAEAAGGIGAVELVVQAATSGQVKVGVFEDVAGGAGPEWRAGVWLAAYVAVSVLDKDLTDFLFEATSSGHVDGASASALMSAGLVAAILGWKVDAAATMTGTIYPDGTVGPVSGIPQKFGAAIAAGKRRLGYPVGQRLAYDAATGAEVDLVALAREHGAEAIEVADIYGAIELMTGRALPRPQPLASAAMEVPAEIADRVARGSTPGTSASTRCTRSWPRASTTGAASAARSARTCARPPRTIAPTRSASRAWSRPRTTGWWRRGSPRPPAATPRRCSSSPATATSTARPVSSTASRQSSPPRPTRCAPSGRASRRRWAITCRCCRRSTRPSTAGACRCSPRR